MTLKTYYIGLFWHLGSLEGCK